MGELELRGLPQPLPAFEVSWESAGGARPRCPLPSQLAASAPAGYVGRERERDRLRERWDAALAGPRQGLLVSGEPGIGKTRFLDPGARWSCTARAPSCSSATAREELQAPYGAWIQALSHYVEHAPQDLLAEHVERHGGELSRLVPGLARRIPDAPAPKQTDPETERYLLFSAVAGLLEGAGRRQPGGAAARRPALGGRAHARPAEARARSRRARRDCCCWAPTATATSRARIRSPACWRTCAARRASSG